MNPTLEIETKVFSKKMNMEFKDDREFDCAAVVTWEYVEKRDGYGVIITMVNINPINTVDGGPRISNCDLISNAYDFIISQYEWHTTEDGRLTKLRHFYVDFECRGNVTIQ